MSWAEYVKRTIGGDNQVAVAAKTGITQSTVSRWLAGQKTPGEPAVVARFAQSYGANVLEAFVAAGMLSEEEAGIPPAPHVDFASVIDNDPDLSEEAKAHIKNQYGLLKAASATNRAMLLREQIERNPNLDDETRAQLLATLDGGPADQQVPHVSAEMARQEARRYPRLVQEAARESTGDEPDAEDDAPAE
jgi:transcriptional regulator with XRE-family HTH domain